jgi:spermidine/putrescine-binding protein
MGELKGQTRRQLIERAAGLGALFAGGGVLAACGGGSGSSGASTAGSTGFVTASPASLNFVGWQGYDAKPAKTYPSITAWESQNSVTLTSTYTQTNEEMLTKIQASPSGSYDLTSPYHGTVPTMIDAGALEVIDTARMHNYASLYKQITGLDYARGSDGKIYAVPLDFSYSVGLYNADSVQPLNLFSDVITDPSLKGRYIFIDAPETFTWIAQYLGLGNPDPHHLTPDELAQCQQTAHTVISNAKATPGSFGDCLNLMLTHEADWSLSGNPSDAISAQAKGVNIQTFLPTKGAQAYVDNYCIPKGSGHYDSALAWIDEVISPKGQADMMHAYGTGSVNPAAVPLLDASLKKLYDYKNIDSAFKATPVWPPIPATSDTYATYADWTKSWDEAK